MSWPPVRFERMPSSDDEEEGFYPSLSSGKEENPPPMSETKEERKARQNRARVKAHADRKKEENRTAWLKYKADGVKATRERQKRTTGMTHGVMRVQPGDVANAPSKRQLQLPPSISYIPQGMAGIGEGLPPCPLQLLNLGHHSCGVHWRDRCRAIGFKKTKRLKTFRGPRKRSQ